MRPAAHADIRRTAAVVLAAALFLEAGGADAQAANGPSAAAAQADAGKTIYAAKCANCHGDQLDDGGFGPPLKGDAFQAKWRGQSAEALFSGIKATMPPGAGGSLSDGDYAASLAFVLQANGAGPKDHPLPASLTALRSVNLFSK